MSLREWEEIWRKGRICHECHERWCQKSLWNQDKLPLVSPCPLNQSPTRKVVGQGFQLHKHRLTNPNSWFLLNMVGNVFQEVLMHHNPGNVMRLAGLQLSSFSFFFLKTGVVLLFFSKSMKLSPFPQLFRYGSDWPHFANSLNTKRWSCQVSWTCACPVHSDVSWVYPALLRVYLHISKLSHGLEGPGIPEDNSSQKNNEEMKTFSTSIFSLPLVISWIATQFNTRTFLALPSLLIFQWKPSSSVPSNSCKCSNCTLLQRANFSSSEGFYSSYGAFLKLSHVISQNTISR